MEKKINIQPHQDMSKPTDEQVAQIVEHEDRIFLDALSEFEKIRQRNLDVLTERMVSDPKFRAQCRILEQRRVHMEKFGSLDFSKLEDRVMANAVTGRMSSSRSNIEEVSDTLDNTFRTVRGVVYSRPIMADNIPRDGRIKLDKVPSKRMLQTDQHEGRVKTSDLSEALIQTMADSFELNIARKPGTEEEERILSRIGEAPFNPGAIQISTGPVQSETGKPSDEELIDAFSSDTSRALAEMLGVPGSTIESKPFVFLDEAPFIPNTAHLPVHYLESKMGPSGDPTGPSDRALRVAPKDSWSAERRDRAATSAPVRKKLRDRTRAQKKARRKQR